MYGKKWYSKIVTHNERMQEVVEENGSKRVIKDNDSEDNEWELVKDIKVAKDSERRWAIQVDFTMQVRTLGLL